MSLNAVYLVLALIAAATVIGVLWRRRQGAARVPAASSTTLIRPADVADSGLFGDAATLLQFSTEFCSSCPATRRVLGAIAEQHPGVTHVDVDLTHRGDLANRFNILQTPTTFILDGSGELVARIGGSVRRAVIEQHLESLAGARS